MARQQDALIATVAGLDESTHGYSAEYFGHFLNEQQIDDARAQIAQMATAAQRLYGLWQCSRASLPTSQEIGRVVERSGFRALGPRQHGEERPWTRRVRRFTRLVRLNEEVRRTTETVTEALPIVRDQILYARHYERNCARLYGDEVDHIDRLRDAEDMRLGFEQILRAIEGDVDALRAQAQSLTLYAQMHLSVQIQILTWMLLLLTAAGVVATIAR